MFLDPERKSLNVALRFIHLGLQIAGSFWAVMIDGYPCQQQNVKYITYFAYALIGFNLALFAFFSTRTNTNKALYYVPLFANLALAAGMLYFTIEGYNQYNSCAPTRALYEFFFIEIVIALVLFVLIMFAKVAWADRYAHWPGNIAWPILFLKSGFPGVLHTPSLVIGIIFAFVSLTGFIINAFYYSTFDLHGKRVNALVAHWSFSMVVMFACEILAIVMLVVTAKDGDYVWDYSRKIFVIFAGVNVIDFFFWFYGYRRLSAWATHTSI